MKLAVISIHSGKEEKIIKTCYSVDSQILKPDLHLVVSKKVLLKKIIYKKNYRKIIFGKDNSIYDAMNLGLLNTKKYLILFLNSGDIFFSNKSIFYIKKFIRSNNCLQFKTVLKFKNNYFYPKKNFFMSKKYFAHPSFLRPPTLNLFKKFDLKKGMIADMIWIKENIKIHKLIKIDQFLSIHFLGGISSNPSINSIKFFKQSGRIFFIKEIIKFFLKKILNLKLYYKLIYLNKFTYDKN